MAVLSDEMVDAARQNDWDRLEALERQVANERDALRHVESEAESTIAHLSRKAALIRRILANADEVRTHVDPFLESTRKLLSGAVRDNNVRKAYGAFGP